MTSRQADTKPDLSCVSSQKLVSALESDLIYIFTSIAHDIYKTLCALATTEIVKGSTFGILIWMIDNDDIQSMLIVEADLEFSRIDCTQKYHARRILRIE